MRRRAEGYIYVRAVAFTRSQTAVSLTDLLVRAQRGDLSAWNEALPLVYDDLRRIAAAHRQGETPNCMTVRRDVASALAQDRPLIVALSGESASVVLRTCRNDVEVYKSETREIIKRFMARTLNFPDCIAALDAALAGLVPRLQDGQLSILRALMLANNEIVMKEMERRGPSKETSKPRPN